MHISPLYTDAHWRKIHGMGLFTAMMFAALVSLWPGSVSVFLFLALYLSPMVFNAVFHITASVSIGVIHQVRSRRRSCFLLFSGTSGRYPPKPACCARK